MQTTNRKFFYKAEYPASTPQRNAKQQKGKQIKIKTGNELQKTTRLFHKHINTFNNSGLIIPLHHESSPPLKRFLYSKKVFNNHDTNNLKISPTKISYSPIQQKTFLPIVIENANGLNEHLVNDYYKYYPTPKISTVSSYIIKGYGTNTYRGLVRNYNEDRLAISLGMKCPNDCIAKWPKDLSVSFFGIYDGHAGDKCSEYLKNNLHNLILTNPCFSSDPIKAIQNGFNNAEKAFMVSNYKNKAILDYSGSCVLFTLIVNNMCYIANVGDSRAIYSYNSGNECFQLTRDHKPNDLIEKERIIKEGGSIYKATAIGIQNLPWRILPGKLSVSRAFGDLEAKISLYGGNPNVLIASPCITTIKLDDKSDFIILGCDGIYDKLTNEEIISMAWSMKKKNVEVTNIHQHCGLVTDTIMKYSLKRYTVDNISVIFISFDNFMKKIQDTSFEYSLNRRYNVVQMGDILDLSLNNNQHDDKIISNNNNVVGTKSNNSNVSFLPIINNK